MNRHRYVGHKRRILTDEEVRAILAIDECDACHRRYTNADIARMFGVAPSTISHIRKA